jgi:hypothetical protein
MAMHPSRARRHGKVGRVQGRERSPLYVHLRRRPKHPGRRESVTLRGVPKERRSWSNRTCAKRAIQPASHRVDDRGCSRLSTEEGNTRPPRHRKGRGSRRACPSLGGLGPCCHARKERGSLLIPARARKERSPPLPKGAARSARHHARRGRQTAWLLGYSRATAKNGQPLQSASSAPKQCNGCGQRRRPRARGGSNARERVPARRNSCCRNR